MSVRGRRRPFKAQKVGGLGVARMATWAPGHVRVSGTCMAVILAANRPPQRSTEDLTCRLVEAHATEVLFVLL